MSRWKEVPLSKSSLSMDVQEIKGVITPCIRMMIDGLRSSILASIPVKAKKGKGEDKTPRYYQWSHVGFDLKLEGGKIWVRGAKTFPNGTPYDGPTS